MDVLFAMPAWLFVTSALLFGLVVGSFLNVVLHRLPVMLERDWTSELAELAEQKGTPIDVGDAVPKTYNLAKPDSACPHCGHKITALENIPVISWLVLRGKCCNCHAPISARYPAVELLTGVATAIVAWRFGPGWEALAGILLTWYLIPLSAIDIDHQILPDIMTLPLLWIGLTLSLFSPQPAEMLFIPPNTAIVGALAGYLSLWTVYQCFRLLTGKEGMGYGDFKLLAALGAWLGWQILPMLVLIAAATGTVFAVVQMLLRRQERGQPMTIGQWLAAAGWIILVGGQPLQAVYQRLLGL